MALNPNRPGPVSVTRLGWGHACYTERGEWEGGWEGSHRGHRPCAPPPGLGLGVTSLSHPLPNNADDLLPLPGFQRCFPSLTKSHFLKIYFY